MAFYCYRFEAPTNWEGKIILLPFGADQQEIEILVLSIGFPKMHYTGPGASWWGADMAIIPHGKVRCFVSRFRLVYKLDKDPVADNILANVIRFVNKK